MIVIGLMSGTSADGIDAAVVEITGAPPTLRWKLLHHTTLPHSAPMRAEILACCDVRTARIDQICALHAGLGKAFGQAALAVAAACGLSPEQIDLVGSHGQTIWHAPEGKPPGTLQIGAAAEIAELVGAPVVSDFRARDIAIGGQGAPLVPAVDLLLLSHPTKIRAAQNIGGIANMTYLPPGGIGALAFDTGPGNMLIDSAMRHMSGGREAFDKDGMLAAQGHVHGALLEELLDHPFLQRVPPKSTGRETFGAEFSEHVYGRAQSFGLSNADLIATLTAFTVHTIAAAYHQFLPHMPDEVILSGGGVRNTTMLRMLSTALAPAQVLTSDSLGIPADAKEALAFAVLAYETWCGRPGNLPAATGAPHPVVLGSITAGGRMTTIPLAEPDPGVISSAGGLTTTIRPAAPDPVAIPLTETRNPASVQIDTLPTIEMLTIINREDASVAAAVRAELPQIARAVDAITDRIRRGGRLIYLGAGTSGRLGALDAAECPPTFGTPPELVLALIAGGPQAANIAIEGAEDDAAAGARDIHSIDTTARDVVVGIAASGSTPYVVGALQAAQQAGALTISLACSQQAAIATYANIAIAPLVGPEVITGSTRLKAGTAQKMVLNMLTSGAMIQLGKTYGNLMVDVQPTNHKLRRRALRIVCEATGLAESEAATLLTACQNQVKTAIVAALADITPADAQRRLTLSNGRIREALR